MEEEANRFNKDIWCCIRDLTLIWFIAGKLVILFMAFCIGIEVLNKSKEPLFYKYFVLFDLIFSVVLVVFLILFLFKCSFKEHRSCNTLISDGSNITYFAILTPLCCFFVVDLIMTTSFTTGNYYCLNPYFFWTDLVKIPIVIFTMIIINNYQTYTNFFLSFKGKFIRKIIILFPLISFMSDYANHSMIYIGASIHSNIIRYYNISSISSTNCTNGFLILDRCLISFCGCITCFYILILLSLSDFNNGDIKEFKGVKQDLNKSTVIPSWVMVISVLIFILTCACYSLQISAIKSNYLILNINFSLICIGSIFQINEVRTWESLKTSKRILDRLIIWIGFMNSIINSLHYFLTNENLHGILLITSTLSQTILFDLISTRYITRPRVNSYNEIMCPLYIIMCMNAGILVAGFRPIFNSNKPKTNFYYDTLSTIIDVNGNFYMLQRLHAFIFCLRIIKLIYH